MGNQCCKKQASEKEISYFLNQKSLASTFSCQNSILFHPSQHVDYVQHVELKMSEESMEDFYEFENDRTKQKVQDSSEQNKGKQKNLNQKFLNMLE